MYYKVDFNINEFKFWAGAQKFIDECIENDWLDDLERLIEEEFKWSEDDEIPTDTQINDFVWFDAPDLLEDFITERYSYDD